MLRVRAYREAIAEGGGLGLGAKGDGGRKASDQGRFLRLDGVDGGAGAQVLLQVQCEPPGSHCGSALCGRKAGGDGGWQMAGGMRV
jgi:hypothetical protein